MIKWLSQIRFIPFRNNFKFLIILILLYSFLGLNLAWANSALYQISFPVENRNPSQLKPLFQKGLSTLIVKLRGDETLLQHPDVQKALEDPKYYVQSFEYVNHTKLNFDSSEHFPSKSLTAENNGGQNLTLDIHFSEAAVHQLFRSLKLSVWENQRPITLFWVAQETEQGRQILSTEDLEAFNTIQQNAKQRGIDVLLPLMDFTDSEAVTAADVWGNFNESVLPASKRYGTQAVVIGHIFEVSPVNRQLELQKVEQENVKFSEQSTGQLSGQTTGQLSGQTTGQSYGQLSGQAGWQGEWTLYMPSPGVLSQRKQSQWQFGLTQTIQSQSWETVAPSKEAVLQKAIKELANRFAAHYVGNDAGQADGTPKEVIIQISGIQNTTDFQNVENFFHNLSALSSMNLVSIAQDSLTFRAVTRNSIQSLKEAIAFSGQFQSHHDVHRLQAADQSTSSRQQLTLNYQWKPKQNHS